MPRCVQCTVSKKKCNPENRQWPELCDLCIKSGLPCSPFISKQEFDNLSVNELAAYQTKSQVRSPKDLIADIDCLFYLRAGIVEWGSSRHLGSGDFNSGCHNWDGLRERLLYLIDSVIEEVKFEASGVVRQHLAKGRVTDAYFLADLFDKRDSYAEKPIISDYHDSGFYGLGKYMAWRFEQGNINKALLDRSAGLLFRWFRGTTLNSFARNEKYYPYQVAVYSPITEEEATRLYATLKTVSQRCQDRKGPQYICDSLHICGKYMCSLSLDDIFVRIDPPLLRYLGVCNDLKKSTLGGGWTKGLSNLIAGANAVGMLDSMTLRQESLIQLILQDQGNEDMLDSVEKAVVCGLRPAAFHLPYCLGEISSPTRIYTRIEALSESILAPLAGVHVNVSRQDILNAKIIPHQKIKHFDDVQMTPLMYALYTRRYSVIYAILTTKNPDWIFQTSNTALSDIVVLPHRTERLFGPVHVAAWTYGYGITHYCHPDFDMHMTGIFSKLCQDANQLASAIEIAIVIQNNSLAALLGKLASIMILSQPQDGVAYDTLTSVLQKESWHPWYWKTAEWFISQTSLRKTLETAQRDVASLTQPPRAGEIVRCSGDAGKEHDISDREHNDKRMGYESQTELTSTEDNRNRNSANTKASQRKRNETQDEKDGYGSAQGGKSFVNKQHKPMVDFDTLDESKPENDRQTRSSIGSNPAHPKNHIPSWGAQQRQWKVSGGKLSNGSGIMSLASKASASTASSGLSVISFGGMPFTQPRGRGLNFEKPALEEEPEFMDIDSIPTSPP
ncbi:hypothetical protein TWF173_009718 [Orbilia oligospora]|nr:hypothetical protein TWF173_009718 [Orbilia oligospora]